MKSEEGLDSKRKNIKSKVLKGFPFIACDGGVAGAAERTDGVVDKFQKIIILSTSSIAAKQLLNLLALLLPDQKFHRSM